MARPCTKKPRSQQDAEQVAAMLTLKNKLEGRGEAYAYPCLLCPGRWHVTSQPYHLVKKEEANGNLSPVDDGEHDCLDHIADNGLGSLVCGECGEVIDRADAVCTLCGHYPCSCDDQYEAFRDRELGL